MIVYTAIIGAPVRIYDGDMDIAEMMIHPRIPVKEEANVQSASG